MWYCFAMIKSQISVLRRLAPAGAVQASNRRRRLLASRSRRGQFRTIDICNRNTIGWVTRYRSAGPTANACRSWSVFVTSLTRSVSFLPSNSSLAVRCAVTNVGAVINRPAVKCCDSTSVFGEFATSYCRADDIRPYGVLSKTVRQTGIR